MATPDQPEQAPPAGNRVQITFEASGVVGPPATEESTGEQE